MAADTMANQSHTTTVGYNLSYFENVTTPENNVSVTQWEGIASIVDTQATFLMAFMAVIGAVGLIGNALTLYYYKRIDTQRTTNVLLIVTLSIYDVLQCAVVIPMNLIESEIPLVMSLSSFNVFCKCSRYFESSVTTCGCLVLVVIAVDRFKRICRPLGNQFSMKQMKKIWVLVFVFGMTLSAPVFDFYQASELLFLGPKCLFAWSDSGFYYYSALSGLILLENIVLVVVYALIAFSLFSHKRKRREMMKDSSGSRIGDKMSKLRSNQAEFTVTKIMIAVTIAFSISFLPFALVNILDMSYSLDKRFWSDFSMMLYAWSYYSYYITAAVNPLIYGYFNRSFRKWLLSLGCK